MISGEIVIDGYNLLHKLFAQGDKKNIEPYRCKTESLLVRFQKRRKCMVTIVYDGGGVRESSSCSTILTVYTASSKSADAWIIDYVKSLNTNRKMVTIVSSDREVCLYGKAYGAKCLASEEFIAMLDTGGSSPDSGRCPHDSRKFNGGLLDSREVAEWKRLFEKGNP
ncbi:MAG: NYN domain-containing protein [Chlorobi bacterium]|nr:NYN domain-containing protein [Chlorobiota bacterium]